jgi:hypothetical protein
MMKGMVRLTRLAAFALIALLAGAGCKHPRPAPPAIVEVRVLDRTPAQARIGFQTAPVAAAAARAIGQASGIAITDGGVPPGRTPGPRYKLVVEVRTEDSEDPTGHGTMRAMVSERLDPVDAPIGTDGFEESALGEHNYDKKTRGDAKAAWQAHVVRTATDVARGLGAQVRLASGPVPAILAALLSTDDTLREEAMRLAGERKLSAAVPTLIKLLKSDDHEVRDRAIGALSAIGDRRAVRPLTEVARFRDLGDLPKILDALSSIGGEEAKSYLAFVASGHDSPEIRDLAKQALVHLDARDHRDLSVR